MSSNERKDYERRFGLDWQRGLNVLSKEMGLYYLGNKCVNFDVVVNNTDYKNNYNNWNLI